MKRVLITGVTGQDGAYLAKFLLGKGCDVFGAYRRLSTPNFWRLINLDIYDEVRLLPVDLTDTTSLLQVVTLSQPDEIYNLAAQSFVEASFDQPLATAEITGLGTSRILEVVRQVNPGVKFYQASTSELYGNGNDGSSNEVTPFVPASPYAAAKLYAYHMTKIYRQAYGIFACNGILFNHESPLRGLEFVTRKVSNAVARIALGLGKELVLGNLEAKRDWGYAPEYVESMWLMLQQDKPGDYVVATGESHSVEELVRRAFECVNLNWEEYTRSSSRLLRPLEVNSLRGDPSKVGEHLGWKAKVKFDELVQIMVEADLECWRRWLRGEQFSWDAINYPSKE